MTSVALTTSRQDATPIYNRARIYNYNRTRWDQDNDSQAKKITRFALPLIQNAVRVVAFFAPIAIIAGVISYLGLPAAIVAAATAAIIAAILAVKVIAIAIEILLGYISYKAG